MFTLRGTTPDDIFVREVLNGKLLSGGMFVEIHVASLLNRELKTHSDFVIDRENTVPAGALISHVSKTQELKQGKEKQAYMVNKVSFCSNGVTYTVDELTFSMLLKKCFHTKKSTVCFSLSDEVDPAN